jgi:hypothetical protein
MPSYEERKKEIGMSTRFVRIQKSLRFSGAIFLGLITVAAAGYGIPPKANGSGEEARSEVTLPWHPAVQSGGTLFQGIFFGTGPVAEAIPNLGGAPLGHIADPEFRHMVVQYLQDKIEKLRQHGADEAAVRLAALSSELEASNADHDPGSAMLSGQKFDAMTRFLLAEIADENHGFFPAFARHIHSGDHIQIREALLDAEKVLSSTLDRIATPQPHALVASLPLPLPGPTPFIGRPLPLPGPTPFTGIHVNVNVEINTNLAIWNTGFVTTNTAIHENQWLWKNFRLPINPRTPLINPGDRLVNALVVNTIANRLRG